MLRLLNEELAWAIDNWLWSISYIMLRIKFFLSLKQDCIHCYVVLSNVTATYMI